MNNAQACDALDDIDVNGMRLTDWEVEFVDEMLRKSDNPNWTPTEKQAEIIKRIREQRT